MYLVQIDFILLYEYQGFILSPVFFPLTPHGSVHSLGLLFRPDKQVFFVYGNYCLRIVPNVTRLSMRRQAGREGRCDEREFYTNHRSAFCCSSREHLPRIWLLHVEVLYTVQVHMFLFGFVRLFTINSCRVVLVYSVTHLFEEHMCERVHWIIDNYGNMVCEADRKLVNISVYVKKYSYNDYIHYHYSLARIHFAENDRTAR